MSLDPDLIPRLIDTDREFSTLSSIREESFWHKMCKAHFKIRTKIECPGMTWRLMYERAIRYVKRDDVDKLLPFVYTEKDWIKTSRLVYNFGKQVVYYILKILPDKPFGHSSVIFAFKLIHMLSFEPGDHVNRVFSPLNLQPVPMLINDTLVRDLLTPHYDQIIEVLNFYPDQLTTRRQKMNYICDTDIYLELGRLLNRFIWWMTRTPRIQHYHSLIRAVELNDDWCAFFRYTFPYPKLLNLIPALPENGNTAPVLYSEDTIDGLLQRMNITSQRPVTVSKDCVYGLYISTVPLVKRKVAVDFIKNVVFQNRDFCRHHLGELHELSKPKFHWLIEKYTSTRLATLVGRYYGFDHVTAMNNGDV